MLYEVITQVIHATRKGLGRFGAEHPDFQAGIIVIAMRSHGGNMARILLREVIGEKEERKQALSSCLRCAWKHALGSRKKR